MADISFSILGLDAVIAKFAVVTDDIKRKGGRFALRKAANIVAEKAKAGALALDDRATGQSIASNIAVRWSGKRFKATGDLMFRVGVLGGARLASQEGPEAGTPTPHWRLLEFGTSKMPAKPFMRTALSESIGELTDEFVTQYGKALDRAIKRAAKGSARRV